jgi:hypothetical protein
MLKLVLKRVLSFSVVTAVASALLLFDPSSPTLMSEAHACDPQVYDVCEFNCFYGCFGSAGGCGEGCDCLSYCQSYCRGVSGC